MPLKYSNLKSEGEQQEELKDEGEEGRVFIFPTLQFNTIGFREDETTFMGLLRFLKLKENGLQGLKMATGYLNL